MIQALNYGGGIAAKRAIHTPSGFAVDALFGEGAA
jgi:hypothetical protein